MPRNVWSAISSWQKINLKIHAIHGHPPSQRITLRWRMSFLRKEKHQPIGWCFFFNLSERFRCRCQIIKRPVWAAPRVRREFRAQRRIAQGRLCRPRAFESPKGGGGLKPPEPKKKGTLFSVSFFLEVTPGFEPGNQGFADPCLTTWLCHHRYIYIICELLKKVHSFFKRNTHTRLKCGCFFLERATRLELATSTLARWRSTR